MAHTRKFERDKEARQTPENSEKKKMRPQQDASNQKKALRKQARKTWADHVKCSIMPGKKILNKKPLTELYANDEFTDEREKWNQELQRQCDEVNTDLEETRKVQEEGIEYFKRKGD